MTDIHPVFMMSSSKASDAKVPESCIESAEYIIQTIVPKNRALNWKQGEEVETHVRTHFGSGSSYNISTQEIGHDLVNASNADFNFDTRSPQSGEGVAFINIGKDNQPRGYNMHFMAVLVREGTANRPSGYVVSNPNEHEGAHIEGVPLTDGEYEKAVWGRSIEGGEGKVIKRRAEGSFAWRCFLHRRPVRLFDPGRRIATEI